LLSLVTLWPLLSWRALLLEKAPHQSTCTLGAVVDAQRDIRRDTADDDDSFIVLKGTKFSIRYIPVWARYSQ